MPPKEMSQNRTVQILEAASKGQYGVISMVVYDFQMAVALVQGTSRREPLGPAVNSGDSR
jgi:hypothetical protein